MDNLSPDIQFMRMALREAEQAAAEGEVPCGAVIVLNGEVIGTTPYTVRNLGNNQCPCGGQECKVLSTGLAPPGAL